MENSLDNIKDRLTLPERDYQGVPNKALDPRWRVNPITGRMVRRDGNVWITLVKRGLASDPELADKLIEQSKINKFNKSPAPQPAVSVAPVTQPTTPPVVTPAAPIVIPAASIVIPAASIEPPPEQQIKAIYEQQDFIRSAALEVINENKEALDSLDEEGADDLLRTLLYRKIVEPLNRRTVRTSSPSPSRLPRPPKSLLHPKLRPPKYSYE